MKKIAKKDIAMNIVFYTLIIVAVSVMPLVINACRGVNSDDIDVAINETETNDEDIFVEYETYTYDNIMLKILEYTDTPEINVRSLPSKNSEVVGKVKAGKLFYVSEYSLSEDGEWFGFKSSEIGIGGVDSIVWINIYYARVESWWSTENYENQNSEIKVWYDNGRYSIVLTEDTKLRCCPGYNDNYNSEVDYTAYGILPKGTVIVTDVVYKNGNNRFLGFSADDVYDVFVDGVKFGDVDCDSDGIVWVAIENAEVKED